MRNERIGLSSASPRNIETVYYTATGGETTFTLSVLNERTVLVAMRSGLGKIVTTFPTNDTQYIQIVNSAVTLPTGDVAMAGEVFSFVYR
jgi:hypothetical protein